MELLNLLIIGLIVYLGWKAHEHFGGFGAIARRASNQEPPADHRNGSPLTGYTINETYLPGGGYSRSEQAEYDTSRVIHPDYLGKASTGGPNDGAERYGSEQTPGSWEDRLRGDGH